MSKRGDAREFNLLAAGADRSFSKFFLGKFPGGIPDLKHSIDGGPWRMRRGQPPQPPNTQDPTPTPKPLETPEDWILESKPGMPILKGKPEDAGGGSSYFLLVKARRGDDFIAMPIEQTYNFKPVRRGGAINLEDAEAEMKYRREQFSKINTRLAAVGEGEGGADVTAASGGGGGGKATEESTGQANDEDEDSDEEFKDIKARAAVTAALKQRAANHRARRQQQQEAPNLALDDAVAEKHEATWNEVFQEPPKDAEDWEHEDEAADDDLDMGGGGGDEDGSDNDDLRIGGGGGGEKGGGVGGGGGGGKRDSRLGSPSDSDDDDGVAAAARVHRRLKKMMKESGNADGDGMSSEEDDLYTDGDSDDDSDSDMIEDIDALDRMAEDMMSGGGRGGGKKKNEVKEEESSGGGGVRKRKSPTPPAAGGAVFDQLQQDGQAKKPKIDTQQQQAEVTVGPVTADEIVILLRGRGKMSLSDIAAYFKARLKTPQDKKDFTALVKKVAKLDPQPDPDGKKYLILK